MKYNLLMHFKVLSFSKGLEYAKLQSDTLRRVHLEGARTWKRLSPIGSLALISPRIYLLLFTFYYTLLIK